MGEYRDDEEDLDNPVDIPLPPRPPAPDPSPHGLIEIYPGVYLGPLGGGNTGPGDPMESERRPRHARPETPPPSPPTPPEAS
jgi:hypothetical protein